MKAQFSNPTLKSFMRKFVMVMVAGIGLHICAIAQPTMSFRLPDGDAPCVNDEFCVDLTIKDFTDILASTFDISWDAAVLEFTDIRSLNANVTGLDLSDFDLANAANGLITFAWDDNAPNCGSNGVAGVTRPDNETLFQICFKVLGAYGAGTAISIPASPSPMVLRVNTGCSNIGLFQEKALFSSCVRPFSIAVSQETANTGDLVCLDFTVEGFDRMRSTQFSVNWDPSLLELVNVIPGDDIENLSLGNFGATNPGFLGVSWSYLIPGQPGFSAPDGTIFFQVCYRVIGDCDETAIVNFGETPTPFEFTNDEQEGFNLFFNPTPGEVATGDCDPTGLKINVNCGGEVNITEQFCVSVTAGDNFQGVTQMAFLMEWNPSIVEFNAVNPTVGGLNANDFNIENVGNGILGVNWDVSPLPPQTVANGSELFEVCFEVVGLGGNSPFKISEPWIGRANGSSIGINPTNCEIQVIQPPGVVMDLLDASAPPFQQAGDDQACVEVVVSNFSNILAYQFSLNWDVSVMEFGEIRNISYPEPQADDFGGFAGVGSGTLFFDWDPSQSYSLPDGTALFEICFKMTGEPGDCNQLEVVELPLVSQAISTSSNGENIGISSSPAEVCTLFPEGFGLSFGQVEGDKKDTVCVEMTVISFDNITAANFNISWDPTELEFVNYNNPGTWAGLTDANFNDNSPVGILNVDWNSGGTGANIPDGTVVLELCYALIGEPKACYPVTVVDDPPPPVSTTNGNGSIIITAGEICINDKFFILDTLITPASCPNSSDGAVTLVIEGGEGFVGTTWLTTPQQFTPLTATNLPPGPVTFRLFDQANPALIQEFTIEIPVAGELPVADAGIDQVLNCATSLALLSGRGSDAATHSYRWFQLTNDTKVNIPGGNVQQFFASSVGTYILDVSNNTTGCVTSDTVSVLLPNIPTADAGEDGVFNCLSEVVLIGGNGSTMGDTIAYLWTPLDTGIVVPGQETLLNPEVAGPGAYKLTVMNTETSCKATDTITLTDVRVFPAARVVPGEVELDCAGSLVSLDGSASVFDNDNNGLTVTYHWEDAEGNLLANGLILQTDQLGTYTLVATESTGGCTSTDIGVVVPNANAPQVTIAEADPLTCAVDTITLDATIGPDTINYTFQWTSLDGGLLVAGTEIGLTPSVIRSGRFVLTATNSANNCTANDTAFVVLDTISPLVEAGPTFTLDCDNNVFTLDGTGSSVGAEMAYNWFFPDLATSIATGTLMVEIGTPGVYYLEVTNTINGCSAIDSVEIAVDGIPPMPIVQPEQFLTCEAETLTIEATLNPPGDYDITWQTLGGGNIIGPTTQTLSIMVDAPGTYQIKVTDRVSGCASENEVIVGIDREIPTAEAGSPQTITCASPAVTLIGNGSSTGEPFTYNWMTVDGRSDTLTATATTPGKYYLTVLNNRNGCTATDSVMVEIDTIAPVVAIAVPELINCDRSCVNLDASGTMPFTNLTATWSGLDGGTPTPTTGLQTEVCTPGMYQIAVTNNGNGCASTGTVEVIADESAPAIQFVQPDAFSCLVETLPINASGTGNVADFRSITWNSLNPNNTVNPATGQLNVAVNGPGDYELTVILNTTGCSSTQIINVPADNSAPVANAGNDFSVECGETTSLDATASSVGANFVYSWTSLDGAVPPTPSSSMEPMVSGPGLYQLLVTNSDNGCTAIDEVKISLDLPALANAGAAQFICDDATTLTANLPAGTSGVWTNLSTGSLSATNQAEVSATNLADGTNQFVWTLSAPGTCTNYSADTITVTVETAPVANNDVLDIGEETRIGSINLRANDNLNFVSNFGITLLNQPELGIVESLSASGELVFRAFKGAAGETTIEYEICNTLCPEKCDVGQLVIFIEFDEEPEVPNTITPNGDGMNDAFVFDKLLFAKPDQYPDNELIIFNRWGDIIYQAKPYLNDWQGQNNSGQDIPQGTYYYILRLDISNGDIIRGDITVVK